jgi:hypothetical protein
MTDRHMYGYGVNRDLEINGGTLLVRVRALPGIAPIGLREKSFGNCLTLCSNRCSRREVV